MKRKIMECSNSSHKVFNLGNSLMPSIVATSGFTIPREKARQNIAKQFDLLTLESEEAFSRLVMVASRAIRTSITALAFMGEKEHYLRAKLGYDGSTIPREWSICTLTYLDEYSKAFVVPDTLGNPLTKDHLIVNNPPFIRCYAAANIFLDGVKVGTFCACDSKPRAFSDRDVALLIDMAACISELLTLRSRRWIQEHVNGISVSSAILSTIKTPLEDVGRDVNHFQDLVDEVETCSSATTVASSSPSHNNSMFDMQSISSVTDVHHPNHSLTPCSSFSGRLTAPLAFSQDSSSISTNSAPTPTSNTNCTPEQSASTPLNTSRKHMSHSQKFMRSIYHSSSKSNNDESVENMCNTEAALEQMQIVAENLREDVKYLGHAIDLSIQRMLEISLGSSSSSSSSLAATSMETPLSPALTLPNSSPDASNRPHSLHRSFSSHNLYENEDSNQLDSDCNHVDSHIETDSDLSMQPSDSDQQQLMDVEEIFNTLAQHSTSPVRSPTASPSHQMHNTPVVMTDSVKLTSSTHDVTGNHHSQDHSNHKEHSHHFHRHRRSQSHHTHRLTTNPHNKVGVAELSVSIPTNNFDNYGNTTNAGNDRNSQLHLTTASQQILDDLSELTQAFHTNNRNSNSISDNNAGNLRRANSSSSLLRYLSPRFNYNSRHIPRPEDDAHHHHYQHHLRYNDDHRDNDHPSLFAHHGNQSHFLHQHQQFPYSSLPDMNPARSEEIATQVSTFPCRDACFTSPFNSQDVASLASTANLQPSLHR